MPRWRWESNCFDYPELTIETRFLVTFPANVPEIDFYPRDQAMRFIRRYGQYVRYKRVDDLHYITFTLLPYHTPSVVTDTLLDEYDIRIDELKLYRYGCYDDEGNASSSSSAS